MLNLVQYILIGIIPIVLTLKAIKIYIPEEDDTKQTLEISFYNAWDFNVQTILNYKVYESGLQFTNS